MAQSERDESSGDESAPAAQQAKPAEQQAKRDEQQAARDEQQAAPAPERRAALRTLVTLGGLAYAAAIAVPAARFLASAAEEKAPGGARWIRVGKLADLAEGTPQRLSLRGDERDAFTETRDQELGSVWILRRGEAVSALSATCPHLGCAVDLAADQRSFACPCHASRFGLDGAAEAGPSPRALDPLATRVVDGVVEVDFRRFRQGLGERRQVAS